METELWDTADTTFCSSRIRLRLLLLINWCQSATTGLQTIHGSILILDVSNGSVNGSPWLHFEPLKLMRFDFNADPDPDPALHSNADSAEASQNNADPDPQPYYAHC